MDKQVHITSLRNTTGLYFESISPVQISYSTWDFVTYVNITIYEDKFQNLKNYFQFTSDICTRLKAQEDETLNNACITFLQTTYPIFHEIELNFNSVMKSLASNAKFFYSRIQNLKESNQKTLHLAQEQLRIISSVVQDLSEQSTQMLNTIDILNAKNLFNEHTTLFVILLNQFAWETQNLQTIVNFALNWLMHTSVYPPSELYHEMKKIQLLLPLTLELPVVELHLDLPELFRASTLSVVYLEQTLMFVAKIQLLSNIPFNLYHKIPLPITIPNGNIVLINPDTQYLAVSLDNEYHFSLKELQYYKCKSQFSFKLCIGLESIFKRTKKENCEVSLYNNPDSQLDTCHFRYLSLQNTLWHKLQYQNAWLYYCTHQSESKFTISLKKITEHHEPQKISNHTLYIHFNKLARESQELKKLKELYKDTTENIFVKLEHHLILLYIIVITLVIGSLYLVIKYRCNIPKLYSPEIAEPHIVQKIAQSRTA
ncbi:Envelope fusion protein [Aphis craccivora]|uniref:Envelope fusion protein n=1 Tax=Aphis craccivora TaxID=307492 RepID=A0A6G0YM90_APHCR|nr:Envelope fusion protein [Aphis craccivora]